MNLATPIQMYFDADRKRDEQAVADTFQPDAVVRDEGKSYSGRRAIQAWWREAKALTPHVVEPVEIVAHGNPTTVRARVSGEFTGSPIVLTFAFRLEGGHIAALEICP